ncbi:hypothetical protein BLA29_000018 [Euroglyphus maynei]|uniref:Uncharacterized protein n=1 Tax=Euroglyphus maynei TaxID=6958 RepID=A0A1Y3AXY6_EURMA|nr:hypothetical protein BLA29_000018 [Euroglyphus maynei]
MTNDVDAFRVQRRLLLTGDPDADIADAIEHHVRRRFPHPAFTVSLAVHPCHQCGRRQRQWRTQVTGQGLRNFPGKVGVSGTQAGQRGDGRARPVGVAGDGDLLITQRPGVRHLYIRVIHRHLGGTADRAGRVAIGAVG